MPAEVAVALRSVRARIRTEVVGSGALARCAVPYAHGDTLRTLAAPTRACTCGTRPSADGTVQPLLECWDAEGSFSAVFVS